MKLAAIGDLHGQCLPPPAGVDLLLLAGDLGPDGDLKWQRHWFLDEFRWWLRGHGIPTVAVAGNHDHILYREPDLAAWLPWTYLRDAEATVAGLRVYGLPWVPKEDDSDWNRRPERVARKAAKVPDGLDVLLLHAPPHGCGDLLDHKAARHPDRRGSPALRERVLTAKPRLVLSGHNHSTRGRWTVGDSVVVNCTTGYNGSRDGRGYEGKKPHGWKVIDWPNGLESLR